MSDPLDSLRVAIVHDWFAAYAGSERVVEQILHIVPQADVHALVDFLPESDRAFLGGRTVTTSYLQKMPFARRAFRKYLALMPHAIEQFDMSGYDLVISSSHAVAKGVLTGPDQLHVCVCHSPMRYAWDLYHQYIRGLGAIQAAAARGVASRLYFPALHRMGVFSKLGPFDDDKFPNSLAFEKAAISLPIFTDLTRQEQRHVVDTVIKVLLATRKKPF